MSGKRGGETVLLRLRRDRSALVGILLVVLVGVVLTRFIPGGLPSAPQELSYALVSNGRLGEVVAFRARSSEIVRRLTTAHQPDVALSLDRERLYLADTRFSDDTATATDTLRVVDTRTWDTLGTTLFQDRARYGASGPSGLTVSPDGARLFVYSSNAIRAPSEERAEYWLTVVDTASLEVLPTRIELPRCGVTFQAVAGGRVVVVCGDSGQVHFVDPNALRVAATVELLGSPAGLAVASDRESVYIVTTDLKIVEIHAPTGAVVREETTWRRELGSVPLFHPAAITDDGRFLIVSTLSIPLSRRSAFSLSMFDLPSLTLGGTISLPRYANLVAAPGGGLYLFDGVGSAPPGGSVQMLAPDLAQVTPLLQLDGPVDRLVP